MDDTCSFLRASVKDWSENHFKYKTGSSASAACSTSQGSIGHLHLYGSKSQDPYLHQISNSDDDPYTDTGTRICKGIEFFSGTVGKPDVIVFQTMMWDVFLREQGFSDESILVSYRQNILERIQDIKNCKDSQTSVFLRTVPWNHRTEPLLPKMNSIIKNIANDFGMMVFDFDFVLRGWREHFPENENLVFRDSIHLSMQCTSRFGLYVLKMSAEIKASEGFPR